MGIYVYLDIHEDAIDAADWRDFYAQALDFLTRYPDVLVGLSRETIECGGHSVSRWVYSTRLEQDADDPARRHLRIDGDQVSLKMAETFSLYEDIAHYRPFTPHKASVSFISEALEGERGGNVFNAKTQGYPYHLAVLAVGMLAEARFPGRALVSGNIGLEQCLAAASRLDEIAGVSVPLPLLVDGDRLYDTLVGQSPTLERIEHLLMVCPHREVGVEILHQRAPRSLMLDWLASQLRAYDGQITLGLITALRHWLNVTKDLDGLIEALTARAGDSSLKPGQLAAALVSIGVTLDPVRVKGLEGLDRPDEVPDSVYSQFGNAMLDVSGLSARNCRCRLGFEPVMARLSEQFPLQREEIRDTLEQRTRALKAELETLGVWVAGVRGDADRDPETGDGESFLRDRAGDDLSPRQDELLRALGSKIGLTWTDWRVGVAARVVPGVEGRHALLMRILAHRQMALTERAWRWIDAERDEPSLDLLILLAADTESTEFFTNLRRGIFEHEALCSALLQRIL